MDIAFATTNTSLFAGEALGGGALCAPWQVVKISRRKAWLQLQQRQVTRSPTPYEALSADGWRGKPTQQEFVEVLRSG